jgi:hypothetical protein
LKIKNPAAVQPDFCWLCCSNRAAGSWIEEPFGRFHFGGGNAQLDLATMEFEWACG